MACLWRALALAACQLLGSLSLVHDADSLQAGRGGPQAAPGKAPAGRGCREGTLGPGQGRGSCRSSCSGGPEAALQPGCGGIPGSLPAGEAQQLVCRLKRGSLPVAEAKPAHCPLPTASIYFSSSGDDRPGRPAWPHQRLYAPSCSSRLVGHLTHAVNPQPPPKLFLRTCPQHPTPAPVWPHVAPEPSCTSSIAATWLSIPAPQRTHLRWRILAAASGTAGGHLLESISQPVNRLHP